MKTPPELSFLHKLLGKQELAVTALVSSLNYSYMDIWYPQIREMPEDFKSKYSQEDISEWIKRGEQITPTELATQIRDVLTYGVYTQDI